MKQLLIIIAAFTASCGATTKKYERSKTDTFQVVGMYRDMTGKVKIDGFYCVAKDSFDFVEISDGMMKKIWFRDTLYYTPSLTSYKFINSDSTTKDTTRLDWVYTKPEQILLMSGSMKNGGRIDNAFKKGGVK